MLALAISASLNAPIPDAKFGVFRMMDGVTRSPFAMEGHRAHLDALDTARSVPAPRQHGEARTFQPHARAGRPTRDPQWGEQHIDWERRSTALRAAREVLRKMGEGRLSRPDVLGARTAAQADALTNLVFAEVLSQSTYGGFIITVLA